MGTAPWRHWAFFGSNLQRLRSGEPQGRLTDRLAGFRSRGGSPRPLRAVSAVGSAGPAVRGSSCSLPASSEPWGPPGCLRMLHLLGQERASSPRPRCERGEVAQRTGRGRACKATRPERGKKREREDALFPNAQPLQMGRGEPREDGPELTRTALSSRGRTPRAEQSRGGKGGRRVSRFPFRFKKLLSVVSPTPVSPAHYKLVMNGERSKSIRGDGKTREIPRGSGIPRRGSGVGGEWDRQALPAPTLAGLPVPGAAGTELSAVAGRAEHKCGWIFDSLWHVGAPSEASPAGPPAGRAAHGPGLSRAHPSQRLRVPKPLARALPVVVLGCIFLFF